MGAGWHLTTVFSIFSLCHVIFFLSVWPLLGPTVSLSLAFSSLLMKSWRDFLHFFFFFLFEFVELSGSVDLYFHHIWDNGCHYFFFLHCFPLVPSPLLLRHSHAWEFLVHSRVITTPFTVPSLLYFCVSFRCVHWYIPTFSHLSSCSYSHSA